MIEFVTVTNHLGESIKLELRSPGNSGLLITNIDGLGPPKANVAMSELSILDGSTYNSARANYRNIVFEFRYMFRPTVEAARQLTYKFFPIKRRIRIEIKTENRHVYTYGYVESNAPNIFSSESGCEISVICPESYFTDVLDGVTQFASITSLFEFPFSNESLVTPLLEMGDILDDTEKTILYLGDVPTGMVIHIHANGSASNVVITNSFTLESLTINSSELILLTGADITIGDDIYISSIRRQKYATLVRGGVEHNILSALSYSQNPTWFYLEKGDNVFAYTASSGLSNLEFEALYPVLYEGI